MEDMSKFFLQVNSSHVGDKHPRKKRKTGEIESVDLFDTSMTIINKAETKISVLHQVYNHVSLGIDFAMIDDISPVKEPLVSTTLLPIDQWPHCRMNAIPYLNVTIEEGSAAATVVRKNMENLQNIKGLVARKACLLEHQRELKLRTEMKSWLPSTVDIVRNLASRLSSSVNGLRKSELVESVAISPASIGQCLGTLTAMNLVIERYEGKTKVYQWNTRMEIMWQNLPFFMGVLQTMRGQKLALLRCVELAENHLRRIIDEKDTEQVPDDE